jgi:predicted enzyme related to lactoylglutathione lyase
MNIKEIAFTCYPVHDMARARDFYENIIGLKSASVMENGGGNWIEYGIGDAVFSLGKMEGFNPSNSGANIAFEVEDFDQAVKKLKDRNTTFKMEPFETPVCHMALVEDTEGNLLIIHKRKQ